MAKKPADIAVEEAARGHTADNISSTLPYRERRENEPFLFSPALHARLESSQRSREAILNSAATILLLVVPLLVLIAWLASALSRGVKIGLTSSPIAGKLTQVEAKAVDFFCSVVVAPLLIALFDLVWFNSIRVTAINENTTREGVPIGAIAAASGADSGSYNLLKFWMFIRTKRWALQSIAFLLIFSGATKSLLSNIIAYEAFDVNDISSQKTLDHLVGPQIEQLIKFAPSMFDKDAYNFDLSQQADFAGQFLGMVTALKYNDANDKLTNNTYIGTNATQASLGSFPNEVRTLQDVPGYRLTMDCKAEPPLANPGFGIIQIYPTTVQMTLWLTNDGAQRSQENSTMYVSQYHGTISSLASGSTSVWPYLAYDKFNNSRSQMYIGFISNRGPAVQADPNNASAWTNSSYGPIVHTNHNVSQFFTGEAEKAGILNAWGLRCAVERQEGFHNFTRTSSGGWNRTSSRWIDGITRPGIALKDWEIDLNFFAPGATIPGIGAAVARTQECTTTAGCSNMEESDFPQSITNTLYAVGEAERIFRNVAMQNSTTAPASPFSVTVMGTQTAYRITYVPLLLLLGLLSCILASLIPVALLVYNWRHNSESFRRWRGTDTVRLIVDAVVGLKDEASVDELQRQNNAGISQWSKRFHIRYRHVGAEKGSSVQLQQAQTA